LGDRKVILSVKKYLIIPGNHDLRAWKGKNYVSSLLKSIFKRFILCRKLKLVKLYTQPSLGLTRLSNRCFVLNAEVISRIISEAKAMNNEVVRWRREIHSYPELGFQEVRTSKMVEEELKSLGYTTCKVAETGIVASVGSGEPVIGLRADMDALPIQEENDVPYKSKVPGRMHACGHDAHTAMLLGAAHIIKKLHDEGLIKGTTKLIFQPAEEIGTGAKAVVDSGAVDDVKAFFGIHVWPFLPAGIIGIKDGPFLASCDDFKVVVKGKGGHPSSPHEAIDPISVVIDIANAYMKVAGREIDPLQPVVISVTSIRAGNTYNIIPEEAIIEGTVRTLDREVRNYVIGRLKNIGKFYAEGMGCAFKFHLLQSMPPTVNDPGLGSIVREALQPLRVVEIPKPVMGSEDFSFYGNVGATYFVALGTGNEKKGTTYPNHHPRFNIDEDVLWVGVAAHTLFATYAAEKLE